VQLGQEVEVAGLPALVWQGQSPVQVPLRAEEVVLLQGVAAAEEVVLLLQGAAALVVLQVEVVGDVGQEVAAPCSSTAR
jgi:hypothetical protein